MKKDKSKILLIIVFTIFPFIFLITFTYLPIFQMIRYSFTDWDGVSKILNYVGLDNYKRILTDSQYFGVFKVRLKLVF